MDDNDYSSRDELDLETGGRAAMEVSDSSDDEAAPLPAFSRSRTGRNLAPGPAASGAFHRPSAPEVHPSGGPIDEWRQTVEGFDGGPEADDELEGAETIDLDSSDGEGQQDVDDPATLAEQEQDEMAELRIPVQSLASALGGYEDVAMDDGTTMETYVPGDDCLGCLRDLRKLWRRDDEDPSRKVARIYAEVNLMGNDLIPIVLATVGRSEQSHKISLAALDLITSMTWPVHVEEEARVAHEHGENLDLLLHLGALEKAQQEYKARIIRSSISPDPSKNLMHILVHDILVPALMTPRMHRTERHTGTISMCMHLVRNLLEVRDPKAGTNAPPEALERSRAQSRLVTVLDKSNFLDVLLMLCSTSAEDKSFEPWAPVAMACVYHLYIGTSVRAVAGFWQDWEDPSAVEQDNEGSEAQRVANERRAQMQHQLAQSLFAEEKVKRTHQLQAGARHPKFGTTIAYCDSNGRHRIARNPIALRKTVQQLQSEVEKRDRRRPARRRRAVVEPGGVVHKPPWTSEGVVCVRRWADRFVQQGFTPLTKTIWLAIRGEHANVGNVDLARLRIIQLGTWFLDYFLTRRGMYADMMAKRAGEELEAERKRQQELQKDIFHFPTENPSLSTGSKEKSRTGPHGLIPLEEAWDFSDIFEWIKPWALRLVFVRSSEALEMKSWLEFNAVINLWTMLFRVMDALTRSSRPEDRTVGEVAQEQVFYDREMLKQCRAIMGAFKSQSVATLSGVVAFTYTMPKLLERFSQGKEYMYVRARDKARSQTQEEQDDLADQHRAFKEQAFTFVSFQRDLATRPIASTAILYLERWPDFTMDHQLEMVVHIMHRLTIKCNNPGLFFGPKERDVLNAFSDPEQMAQVEAIAPKASRNLKKLVVYLQRKWNKLPPEEQEAYRQGRRAPRPPKPPEPPKELIVRGARPGSEKLSIAAAVLIEEQKLGVLNWLITGLELALSLRQEVEGHQENIQRAWDELQLLRGDGDQENEGGAEKVARLEEMVMARSEHHGNVPATPQEWVMKYDGDTELEEWASTHPEVQLLLRLAGLNGTHDKVNEHSPWQWVLPPEVANERIRETVDLLHEAVAHPFRTEDGQPARKLLMKKPTRSVRPTTALPGDEAVHAMIVSDEPHSESEESDASATGLERRMAQRASARAAAGSTQRKSGKARRGKLTSQASRRRRGQNAVEEESDVTIDSEEEMRAIEAQVATQQGSRGSSVSSRQGKKSPFDEPAGSDGGASTSSPTPPSRTRPKGNTRLFLGSDDEDLDGALDGDQDGDQDWDKNEDNHKTQSRDEEGGDRSKHGIMQEQRNRYPPETGLRRPPAHSSPHVSSEPGRHDRAHASSASATPAHVPARTPSAELSPQTAKARERAAKEAALRAALLESDEEEKGEKEAGELVDGEGEQEQEQEGAHAQATPYEHGRSARDGMSKAFAGLKRSWERHMSLEDRPAEADAAYRLDEGVLDKTMATDFIGLRDGFEFGFAPHLDLDPDADINPGPGPDREPLAPRVERRRRAVVADDEED